MVMLKTRNGQEVNTDLHVKKAFEAIWRAEYARLEDAHKDIISALFYIAYLMDALETKVSKMK
jgi:hypothetical protein